MKLDDLFKNIDRIPKVSKVVQELIENFENDDFSLDEVSKKIAVDQMSSARVLRLANTVRFGGARSVASVDDAVVRLGFDKVKTLIIASGLGGAVGNIKNMDMKDFWIRTFQVATICKDLAKDHEAEPEIAFTCGMMHSIGEVIIAIYCNSEDIDMSTAKDVPSAALVGQELAKQWQFPAAISDAVGHQDDPLSADPITPYACLIGFAKNVVLLEAPDEENVSALIKKYFASSTDAELQNILDNIEDMKTAGAEFAEAIS